VELAWGSQSTNRDRTSAAAKEAARLMAVVVFPTPPFWFATAITIPMSFLESNESRVLLNVDEWGMKVQRRKMVHF
jgi:hypothetical protein